MNNIMDKVSLEMAIKLKEIGFNAYCRNIYVKVPSFIKEIQDKYPNWYFEEIRDEFGEDYERYVTYNYEVMEHVYYRNEDLENDVYACPTIIDVYEWLREQMNIYITIMPSLVPNEKGIHCHKFHIHVFNMELLKSKIYSDSISYEDYNEARFKAIEYVLFHDEIFDMVEGKYKNCCS